MRTNMQAEDLSHFKKQLLEMHTRLSGELRRRNESKLDTATTKGDLSDVPTHNADQASDGLEKHITMEKMESNMLNQVDAALTRIDSGDFGICENCGAEISRERLDSIPYTPYCVRCEAQREAESSSG